MNGGTADSEPPRARSSRLKAVAVPAFSDRGGRIVRDQYDMPFRSEKAAEKAAVTGLINLVRYDNPERAPHLIRVAAEVETALADKRAISILALRLSWAARLRAVDADGALGEDCRRFGRTAFDAVDRYRSNTSKSPSA